MTMDLGALQRYRRVVSGLATVLLLAPATLLAGTVTPAFAQGSIIVPDPANAVPDEYIVALNTTPAVTAAGVAATASRLATTYHGSVEDVYTSVVQGFSIHLGASDAQQLAADPDVNAVEQDTLVEPESIRSDRVGTQSNPPSWGLDRIDQRQLPLDAKYVAPNDAATVHIYIVDSGVRKTHQDFGGRVSVYNAITGSTTDADDCNGHGTHVADIAGGSDFGVAKGAQIVAVKILNCDGKDDSRRFMKGMNWISQNAVRPAVINFSLSFAAVGPGAGLAERAVDSLVASGITSVSAAGNQSTDACTRSPAKLPSVITVGSTEIDDTMRSTSNFGACVDIFAPGGYILAADYANDTGSVLRSGTSMAAPHVAGAAAMVLAMHPQWTPKQVGDAISGQATPNVVKGIPAGSQTPNRLLYVGLLGGTDGGALPDSDLNTMWNTYGDQGNHWTGADGTISVPLPDGRFAWLFSDTFLGTVNSNHSRPPDTPMIHNSIVVQQGNTLTTITGGTAASPESLVGPARAAAPPGDIGYWVYDGTVEGSKLRVLYNHFVTAGSGALSYQQTGTWLATFSLPALTLDSLTDLGIGKSVAWGLGLHEDADGYTYVYGNEAAGGVKFLHLARAKAGAISGGWQFWTGSGWSSSEAASVRMMSGVDGISVEKINGSYVMVSGDVDGFFSPGIVAYFAEKPTGPFADKTYLYTAPEAAPGSGNIVYGPHLHPGVGKSGRLVLSYNVNSLLPDGNTQDAHIYRPRFIDITLPSPADPATLPGAPSNLTASTDAQGVHLAWTASPTSGVTYREYQRDVTTGQTQAVRQLTPITGTTTTPGLLTNGDTYEFYVTAVNAAGESPGSNSVTTVPQVKAPLGTPTNVTATAHSEGTVTLSWSGVSDASWYRIYQKDTTNQEPAFTELPDQVWAISQVVSSLTDGHTYEFQIRAANTGGEGPASASASVTVHMPRPPAPTNLAAQANSDGTINLGWDSVGPYTWYWVFMKDVTAGEPSFTKLLYPDTTNRFTAAYLVNGHTYAFYVTAIDSVGEGLPSNTVSAVSRIALPAAPTSLAAVPGNGQVALSWSGPTPGLWYWVYQRDVTAGETGFTRLPYPLTSGTSFTAGYLANAHAYEFYVTGLNAGGEGPASNKATATPTEPPPAAPTSLTATSLGDDTIRIAWTQPSAELWYWIYQRDVTAGEPGFTRLAYPLSVGTSFTTGQLSLGHTYQFQVSGINSGGEGARSGTASATAALNAPTNLTVIATSDGQARLAWSGSSSGVWYWIYMRDVTLGQTFVRLTYPDSTTTFTAGSLVNGHTYEFKVAGTAGGGDGPASVVVQIVAHGGTPTVPTLSVSAGNGKVSLSWTAPEAGAWYAIYRRCVDCGETGYTKFTYPVTSGTSFVDAGVANGFRYEYRVAAINSHGEGDWSNPVQAKPLPPMPSAPAYLSIQVGDGQAALSWTAPGANLYYWIYVRDVSAGESGFTRLKYPLTSGATTFTAGLLADGHEYQFYVTAANLAGESGRSPIGTGFPKPGTPTHLTATNISGAQVTLSWVAPNPSDVWYEIYTRDVTIRQAYFQRGAYPVSATSFAPSFLTPSHTYEFYVTAIRGDGESASSNVVTGSIPGPISQPAMCNTFYFVNRTYSFGTLVNCFNFSVLFGVWSLGAGIAATGYICLDAGEATVFDRDTIAATATTILIDRGARGVAGGPVPCRKQASALRGQSIPAQVRMPGNGESVRRVGENSPINHRDLLSIVAADPGARRMREV